MAGVPFVRFLMHFILHEISEIDRLESMVMNGII